MAIDSDREPRRLLWPSIFTALGLLVLLGLGTWQLERKAWKEDLVAKIRVRSLAKPMVLDAATMLVKSGEDVEYARVRARGRPLADKALFYFANEAEGPGYHVYVPFLTPSGDILLVNRGFIGQPHREAFIAAARSAAQQGGARQGSASDVEIVGLLRHPGRKGLFAPENDVQRNLWYWRDHAGMAKAVGANGSSTVVPYFLEEVALPTAQNVETRRPADGRTTPLVPRPGVTRIELPNRHLEYALTWYGLAAALIVVYLVYAAKLQRSSRDRRLLGAVRRRSWGNP